MGCCLGDLVDRGKGLKKGKGLSRGNSQLKSGEGLARGVSQLSRGKGLSRGDSQLSRGGGLAPRSKARSEQMRDDRVPLVKRLISKGVTCHICPYFEDLGISMECGVVIGGMHERRKSSSGGSRVNRHNLIPACNYGNGFIESEPKLTRDLFGDLFVVREGDPEWAELSKRHDRMI